MCSKKTEDVTLSVFNMIATMDETKKIINEIYIMQM